MVRPGIEGVGNAKGVNGYGAVRKGDAALLFGIAGVSCI